MEIEKSMRCNAPAQAVWALLLDPQTMGACVPGMKSIDVLSPTEYLAEMHVKFSFISAKFKLRTTVIEQRPPNYLHSQGTGEDNSLASTLKQDSEIFLIEQPDGQTELRMKVQVQVLGRLGTFGLSAMKTKADRLWEEFARNLQSRLESQAPAGA
jgi:carbon monoxide dehydrogenase subunit G